MRRRSIDPVGLVGLVAALCLSAPAYAQYREYYVRGKVVDPRKQPVPDVEVRLRDVETSRAYQTKTGQDGTFKIAGLPHGVYEATLSKEGYAPAKVEWRFESPQETMQRVDVPDVVLASVEHVRQLELGKEAEAGSREATEKIRKGDLDGAIAQLQGLIGKRPKEPSLLFLLGLSYVGKRMYPEALETLTRVAELDPAFPGLQFELGVCHRQLGDPKKALAAFEKGLETDPRNADAAYNAGLVLFEETRVDLALARFEQGLASKPQDPDLLEMAGRCYINQGKLDRALEALEKARAGSTDAAKAAFLDQLIAKLKAQMK